MPKSVPGYQLFKARNIGYVNWKGKRYYFSGAPYNSEESIRAYQDFLRTNCGVNRSPSAPVVLPKPCKEITLAKLADLYLQQAEKIFGGKKSEFIHYRRILELTVERYGHLLARDFGPACLSELRDYLANNDMVRYHRNRAGKVTGQVTYRLARTTINHFLGNLRRVFKWAVAQELLPPERLVALGAVQGLRYDRSGARETEPRQPVEWAAVELVLPKLSPVVADMVRLQWHTGCRPQSICGLKPCEVDRSKSPWVWTPTTHKGKHRGQSLVIFIGPEGQRILAPYLNRPAHKYCFSPRESVAIRKQTGQPRKNRKPKSELLHYKERYGTDTYGQAIAHALAQLADPPLLKPYSREKFAAAGITQWTPHQLRHAKAQLVRDNYGLEAAQAVLGHSSLTATQIYAKKRLDLAKELAAKCG